jgi:hypothetical protein
MEKLVSRSTLFLSTFIVFAFGIRDASAVPSFTEQTGQRCVMCHVGGLGPQLTPFGRKFKLEGYALRAGDKFTLPLAAIVVDSYVETQKDQPTPPAPHYGDNNNFTIDQVSVFLAGGFGGHYGGFSQFTYDGVSRSFAWDQLDLRATSNEMLFGTPVLIGVDINNSPGVQDVWNSLPAWGFPYTSSQLAPSPAATPMIVGALAQRVLGSSLYAWWNSQVYAEAGVYWNPGRNFLRAVGVDINDGGTAIKGGAPYARIAYEKDFGTQNFALGAFLLFANQVPGDSLHDLGIDASWQYIGTGENVFQVNARYTHEAQDLKGSFELGNASNMHGSLDELHFDLSYYWHSKIGATVSPFTIWGSSDELLYAANRIPRPDSTGVTLQIDYTPWGKDISPLGPRFNVRIGAQYTLYTSFNGAGSNFDGTGRNAADNNTFRFFTWFEF